MPFAIFIIPIYWLHNKKFQRDYEKYLETELEGKNFFCYNNRKNGFEFIKEKILPNLPKEIEPIYLNGGLIESEIYEQKFLSNALYKLDNYSRFPHLLKIRNGKAIDFSINKDFFKYIYKPKGENNLIEIMKEFFELK